MIDESIVSSLALYSCEFEGCTKVFSKPSKLRDHERIHTGERPFVCSANGCNKQYARFAHLKRHKSRVHKNTELSDTCPSVKCEYEGCTQTFVSQYNLKKHVDRHHSHDGQYLCSVENCGRRFAKRCQLRSHVFEHQGVLPFQCHVEGCHKKFQQSSHLKRHLKLHEGYICNTDGCQQTFAKWSLLRKHTAAEHRKVHSCKVCQKTFAKNCLLGRHLRVAHPSSATGSDDVVGFSCPYEGCGRTYVDLRNVTAHVVSHHQGQKFTCTVADCNKDFRSQQKLQQHMKTLHVPCPASSQKVKKQKLNIHQKKSFVKRLSEIAAKELQIAADRKTEGYLESMSIADEPRCSESVLDDLGPSTTDCPIAN